VSNLLSVFLAFQKYYCSYTPLKLADIPGMVKPPYGMDEVNPVARGLDGRKLHGSIAVAATIFLPLEKWYLLNDF
jgi:hypothetical protein